ncbi:hypothetical protein [Candidatus Bathycorpusculum sp.]|uniref:hypothetical protein n=1 Tax=Candidatus Bathycorpusculum sp. TaxID=2994959 RepID=UPI002823FD6D|nr:hypothetical protein [Candidatus Termitimicrobium sp.]MCL2432022.1 hypothetical protein [Candidatus Termitimicrobium sp.]
MSITKKDLIRSLNPDDAFNVLMIMLDQNPNLEDVVYQIANQVLCNIDSEAIMVQVYNELDNLDVEELYHRSGKTRYGYIEPSEEAWVMFEEALGPFIDEMKTYQKRDMPVAAKKYCIGIIKGIRKFEKESSSEFTEWAIDAPEEKIEIVFEVWKKGKPNERDIAEVLEIKDENRSV